MALHTGDLKCARDKAIYLWLPDFTKKVNFSSLGFLVGVDPEKI